MDKVLPKVVLLGSAVVFATACGKDDKDNKGYKVKTELYRTEGTTYALKGLPLAAMADPDRYPYTSEIDIKSLKLPITSIVLSEMTEGSGTKNPQTLYECETDCEVDLLGPALENLLKDHAVTVTGTGTFQKIAIGFGVGDSMDWQGKIAAEFTLGGQTYYTKASGEVSTEGPAEEVTYDGFGGGSVSYLPAPIEFSEQEEEQESLTIKLYFDPLYTAYAYDKSKLSSGIIPEAFCAGSDTGIRICTQRLVVAASTQATAPTRERYLVNDSSLISLFFDNDDTPVGGNTVAVFTEGEPFKGMAGGIDVTEPGTTGSIGMWSSGPIFEFTKNADGTYVVSSIVGETNPANEDSGFRAKAFQRANHSGKFETGSGKQWDYTAVKL